MLFRALSKYTNVVTKVLSLVLFLIGALSVDAYSQASLWDKIEHTIAQSEPKWILVDKSPNPNPEFKVIVFRWQTDTNQILAWMIQLPTSEDAAREFYNLAKPTLASIPLCRIGDKCYVVGSSDLFFRKANLVVKIMCEGSSQARTNALTRFAELIASAVPADPVILARPGDPGTNRRTHAERAAKALTEGRYQEAVDEYKKAIELDRNSADLHHGLGLAYMKLSDRAKATEAFKEAIRLRPGWAEAHYDLGRAYHELGQYEAAASSFEEAIRLEPDFFEALISLGSTYQHSGLHVRSVEVLRKAVLLRATNLDAKCALATALILSGEPRDAATVLEEATRLSPQSSLVYSTLGQAYRLLGKYQEALGALQQALRLSPEDPVAYNYLGMTYESLQLKQDAVAAYKQAIAFKSDYAEAHYNLALLYLSLGDRGEAERHQEILKTINPALAEALSKKFVR
ncbi:MAG TPA: tetratricopeptide repeat protein [Pyrinomonadaceae bacterium]|nr:tetratricopeptide repeat protein [Pyrinomonadaceae bacterium]